jgi:hypothetical protein
MRHQRFRAPGIRVLAVCVAISVSWGSLTIPHPREALALTGPRRGSKSLPPRRPVRSPLQRTRSAPGRLNPNATSNAPRTQDASRARNLVVGRRTGDAGIGARMRSAPKQRVLGKSTGASSAGGVRVTGVEAGVPAVNPRAVAPPELVGRPPSPEVASSASASTSSTSGSSSSSSSTSTRRQQLVRKTASRNLRGTGTESTSSTASTSSSSGRTHNYGVLPDFSNHPSGNYGVAPPPRPNAASEYAAPPAPSAIYGSAPPPAAPSQIYGPAPAIANQGIYGGVPPEWSQTPLAGTGTLPRSRAGSGTSSVGATSSTSSAVRKSSRGSGGVSTASTSTSSTSTASTSTASTSTASTSSATTSGGAGEIAPISRPKPNPPVRWNNNPLYEGGYRTTTSARSVSSAVSSTGAASTSSTASTTGAASTSATASTSRPRTEAPKKIYVRLPPEDPLD